MKTYRVREGFVVRMDERITHDGGALVEMDEETASLHIHKLEEVAEEKHPPRRKGNENE